MAIAQERFSEVASGKLAARRFSFASAVLDERTLELLVQGEPVELEPKPLEVLRHLLLHAGEVVTKDEILSAVWPGRILSETVLTKCIARLREVLGDDEQQVIKTVHGYGYRLVAPVSVEASVPAAPAPQFDFKPGDHPPLRPLWSLVRRLGQGSHGEAWLVRHDKTRELRVYKFAPDSVALHALKREITLYRLMHDALGDQAPSVVALDWNLDESPFFLEIEYAPGGSLVDWALTQNGLGQVPLAVRLEIAAQTADALGAAHSMGVLHKDLKPSNILIVSALEEPVSVKLGDFGSGGVLDPARLEAMGITRMGFTQTIKAGAIGGTPLYLAPEVIAGQPATIQADIYALGVILYQLIVGDLWRPMAPGWEQDIADELLREDIAFAAEGHVERRLGTATVLAQRLRTLDQRRAQRTAEQAEKSEIEAHRLEVERVRARRGWVRATVAVMAIGLGATSYLYLKAQRAVATTEAVSDFLNNDVLSNADPWKNPTKSVTIKDALDRSASEIDRRFADRPEVAAQLHTTVGNIYNRMREFPTAQTHLLRATDLYTSLHGRNAGVTLSAIESLVLAKLELNLVEEACPLSLELLRHRAASFPPTAPELLHARLYAAYCPSGANRTGEDTEIARMPMTLRALLNDSLQAKVDDEEFLLKLRSSLAGALAQTGELKQAESLQREILQSLESRHGKTHLRTALQRRELALLLDKTGGYDEAGLQLEQGLQDLKNWSADTDPYAIEFLMLQGAVRVRQGQLDDAVVKLKEAIRLARSVYGPNHYYLAQLPTILASAYRKQKRFKEAEAELIPALALSERLLGSEYPFTLDTGTRLAECLREAGKHAPAWAALKKVSQKGLAALPPQHYLLAGYRREEGLLWRDEGKPDLARKSLAEALATYQHALGPEHPNTAMVRAELADLPAEKP